MNGDHSLRGQIPLSAIQINEDLWGKDSTYKVLDWLQSSYDPETMPPLQVAQIDGRDGLWLIGWDNPGGSSLLATIFGEAYAERQLASNRRDWEMAEQMAEEDRGEYGLGNPGRKESE